ncbi:MAG: beta strand repeat-containing protein, partial [Flavobacteriales bacterium]
MKLKIAKNFGYRSLREIVCLSVITLLSISNSFAQAGKDGPLTVAAAGTIVNAYDALAADVAIGATTITATNIANLNSPAALAQGDLIMIIQMQGATINTTNTAAYGDVTAYNNAGNYEFAYVCGVAGNVISIASGTSRAYTAAGKAQIIRVPQYTNLTVNAGATITAPVWDGAKGGVVVIHASGVVTVNGSIHANAIGFRGGKIDNFSSAAGIVAMTMYYTNLNTEGAEKGESIAGYQTDYDALGGRYGRGAPANGGGGGNGHNAGGGGGANGNNGVAWNGLGNPDLSGGAGWISAWDLEGGTFSANASSGGGRGGYTFGFTDQDATVVGPSQNPWTGDYRHQLGGYGGRPLTIAAENKIFLGGGAGAGDGNDNANADGGDGAGIVYLVASSVAGTGTIQANGQAGFNTIGGGNDAPGGGGGGGTIIVKATVANTITINADGGNGGNQIIVGVESEGPGGGGGGGFVAINAGTPTITVNAGSNGTTNSTAVTEFIPNGATKGATGESTSVASTFVAYPTITATATPSTICLGSSSTLSSSGAASYVWNPGALVGASVSVSPAADQTYTVTGTTASGCVLTNSASVTVTTPPSATISYSGSPMCSSAGVQSVTLTGTAGGTFSSTAGLTIDGVTGAITPATSTAGTYTVTYSIAASGGCPLYTATTSVTVTAAPSATISYSGSPMCSSAGAQSVTFSGTAGGTFSSTAGLTINAATGEIDPATSTAGTYTVTYTVAPAGGCLIYTTTTSVTVTAAPSATLSYSGSPMCSSAAAQPVTFSGTAGGTFSSTAGLTINTATGEIDPATSTAGTYTVTYTVAPAGGCLIYSNTASVTVTAAPSATISYSGSPMCSSAGAQAVTFSGTAGGAFSSTAGLTINAATGEIDPATSTAGPYTVTYTIAAAGGCPLYSTIANVTVTAAPSATISYNAASFCSTAAAQTVNFSGTAGGTFSSTAGLTINAATGEIDPGTSTAGTYTVTYTVAAAGGCLIYSTTASVTITADPSATILYSGSPICSSAAAQAVTLTGSTGGAFSAAPAGLIIDNSTGEITPGTSTAGPYTVTYTIAAAGGCPLFSTTANVTVTAAPTATFSYNGSPFCTTAGAQTVSLAGTAGGTFSAAPAGLTIDNSTGEITPATSAMGTYIVTYTVAAAGGCAVFNGTATVVVSCDYDGDGVDDLTDIDDDNDGILDVVEGVTDTDGDGVNNPYDLDSDNDGITDVVEAGGPDADNDGIAGTGVTVDVNGLVTILVGVGTTNTDSDGDGIANSQDIDSDNDGITDVAENGLTDANNDGLVDGTDADGDGLLSTADQFAGLGDAGNTDVAPDTDGDTRADYLDIDSDNDGITDVTENGLTDANNDGLVDGTDADNDGLMSSTDQSVSFGDAGNTNTAVDTDGDTRADYLDIDSDNDGITDVTENGLTDANNNGLVDGTDADGDGLMSSADQSASFGDAGNTNTVINTDSNGKANYIDIDSDNDGIVDNIEGQSTAGYIAPAGSDTDSDGLNDAYDATIGFGGAGLSPVNTDGADTQDYVDLNADNDADNDALEGWDTDNNGTSETTPAGADADGDGLDDAYDANDAAWNITNGQTPSSFPNLDDAGTSERDWREIKVLSDHDGDGVDDITDIDDDNDGILDVVEGVTDTDGDGVINSFDLDSDNDGITDVVEAGGPDADNDGIAGTGVTVDVNGLVTILVGVGITNTDSDGDGIANSQDIDSDNDGITDVAENGLTDANNDGLVDGTDADGDGLLST